MIISQKKWYNLFTFEQIEKGNKMEKYRLKIVLTCILTLTLSIFTGDGINSSYSLGSDIVSKETVAGYSNVITDYSKTENWLVADTKGNKPVDVFYLYPTTYQKGENGYNYSSVNDSSMRAGAYGAFGRQATAFMPVGNIYAPFYRQADASYTLTMKTIEEQDEAERIIPGADAIAAFNYYLKNYNKGKPFILAGHSQGSNVLLFVLSDIKDRPEVMEKMVAAYVIGFSVTESYIDNNSPLKFATGPDDTGVIISFNTEAPGVTKSLVVRDGAISINPISWKRDESLSPKEDNAGSIRALNPMVCDLTPIKNLASARVDKKRGVVVCDSVDPLQYSVKGFPGVYHSYDYLFYFYNIRDNAQNRVDNFFNNKN